MIAAAPPFVCWTFDEVRDAGTVQPAKERLDSLQGAIEVVPGVRSSGLKFDGFTSRLVRAAKDLPPFGPALTVEAWIAPQEFSWAWTGLVDHNQDARAGFFLALNHLGHVGFYASVDGQWLGCDSKEPLALLKWAHVAGTFDPAFGFTLLCASSKAARLAPWSTGASPARPSITISTTLTPTRVGVNGPTSITPFILTLWRCATKKSAARGPRRWNGSKRNCSISPAPVRRTTSKRRP